ncbi:right-handed parallel beta-helix repeat-containing protein [Streptomyces griseosporeus]|uniref:right-handed parallel beta-helix repeat-containing protein n=1 Tax=Streptomyces griseosporeus TaxID=1910 RepID=UPI0036F881AE
MRRGTRARTARAARTAGVLGTAVAAAVLAGPFLAGGCLANTPHYTPYHTYYVSPAGDDRNDGRSPSHPWRTLAHADNQAYQPGDQLLLEGGKRFRGSLELRRGEAGRADRPVVVGSYGDGRATIEARNSVGIRIYDTAGVDIRDLTLVGAGTARTAHTGIDLYSDLPQDGKLRHVTVSRVDVSGFRAGMQIGAKGRRGFGDVRIAQTAFHDNKDVGLVTYGADYGPATPWTYAHEDIAVVQVQAYRNTGDPKAAHRHTGDGIILGSVQRARVERSSAHDNGTRASKTSLEGPVGIWTYDSTQVLIEGNASYRNHSGNKIDGGGIGLDSNVSRTLVQYNLAFGNDGPGFHAYSSKTNTAHHDNVFRFNVSSSNGRKKWEGGEFDIHGVRLRNLYVYNNTLVTTDAPGRPPMTAIRYITKQPENIVLRNNILVTESGPIISASKAAVAGKIAVQGNTYYTAEGKWALDWGAHTYGSLAAFRDKSGQEKVDGKPAGSDQAPCFRGGDAPAVTRVDRVWLLAPECRALAGGGLDLHALFGLDPGPQDYYGSPLKAPLPVGAIR